MRNPIKLGMLALLASTALMTVSANAASAPNSNGIRAAIDDLSVIDTVQVYVIGGHNHCWYDVGWQGPGWYWCGYAWRTGLGWAGGYGFRGWRWHGRSNYWSGGNYHGGMGGWGGGGMGGWGGGGMGGGGGGIGGGGMGGGGMGGGGGGMGGGGGGMGGGGGGGMGGGGGGGMGGGGMSDVRAKHAITLLGQLDNGLGFYRFSYLGSDQAYVGVMAQEVEAVRPEAIVRHGDGYLRVDYDKLGFQMQTYEEWVAAGERIPTPTVH
jgi:Chaperone of endosialidase